MSNQETPSLPRARQELFRLFVEKGINRAHTPAIARSERAEHSPLSFAQERFWFLQQLEPASPAYHMARVLRFEGLLNVEALRHALEQIVVRHTEVTRNGG